MITVVRSSSQAAALKRAKGRVEACTSRAVESAQTAMSAVHREEKAAAAAEAAAEKEAQVEGMSGK